MFLRLLLAFILIPLFELFLLLKIADHTGVLATVALVVATGILGSYLAKREGGRAWRRFREASGQGRIPGEEIQDGLMVVFAAALLLTPGLLTDAVGFTLLLPAGRTWIRRQFLAPMFANVKFNWVPMHGDVVEGSVVRDQDSTQPHPRDESLHQDPDVLEAPAVRRKSSQ